MFKKEIVFKVLIILSAFIGVILQMFASKVDFMGGTSMILYFTIQSNLAIAIIAIINLIYLYKKKEVSERFYLIKYSATISILLTFMVFNLLLAPSIHPGYLLTPSNIMVHTLTAVFAVIDYLVSDKKINFKNQSSYGLIGPLAYLGFAYLMYFLGIKFSGADFPYFFLDFNQLGWLSLSNGLGIIYWWIIILGIVFGLSKACLELKNVNIKNKSIIVSVVMLMITISITVIKLII